MVIIKWIIFKFYTFLGNDSGYLIFTIFTITDPYLELHKVSIVYIPFDI
jgi:hypothetical protein